MSSSEGRGSNYLPCTLGQISKISLKTSKDICSDEKCRLAWSESDSIQNDLKCGFSWCQSARYSSIAFTDINSILLGNKLKIKLGFLSGDGRHDSFKICHIQFIYKQIYIEQIDNLDHGARLLMQGSIYNRG
ncbi:hypothetical protein Tco_0709771 [Tanacetum coccineum]